VSERNPPGWPEWPDEPDDSEASVFRRSGRPSRPPQPPRRESRGASVFEQPTVEPQPRYRVPPSDVEETQVQERYGYDPYAARPAAPPTQQYPTPPAQYPPPTPPGSRRGADPVDRYGHPEPRERALIREHRGGGRGVPFGLGTLFGVVGLVGFLLALIVLPWFTVGGEDVKLSDIRTSFDVAKTDPDTVLPDVDTGPTSTLPGGLPSPGDVPGKVEQQGRDLAAQAAANAIDSSKSRYLKLYANTLWLVAAVGIGLAVLFSTILSPRSTALSLLLGLRRLAGSFTVLVGIAHGAALWIVFTGKGAPSPAIGVWIGVAGLACVLLGCIIGPKRS
jgi:hypothetical protein